MFGDNYFSADGGRLHCLFVLKLGRVGKGFGTLVP